MSAKTLVYSELDIAVGTVYADELIELGGHVFSGNSAFKIACDLTECECWEMDGIDIPPIAEIELYVKEWQNDRHQPR